MREIVFDLVIFATGIGIGVVLASYLFERKRKEVMEMVDLSLDTIGIKRAEFVKHDRKLEDMSARLEMLERTVSEHGVKLGRDEIPTLRPR